LIESARVVVEQRLAKSAKNNARDRAAMKNAVREDLRDFI
jgi:hypothetical protein